MALLLLVGLLACSSPESETTTATPTSTTWYSVIERAEAIAACMRAEGINAELHESHGVFVPANPAAEEVYGRCHDEIERTMPLPVLSQEESYEAWLAMADCLRGLGIDVPPAPSLEVWREEGNENWDPYINVPGEIFWEVHEQCPQPGLGLKPGSP